MWPPEIRRQSAGNNLGAVLKSKSIKLAKRCPSKWFTPKSGLCHKKLIVLAKLTPIKSAGLSPGP